MHLGSDEEDLPVQAEDATIVQGGAMQYWHANIAYDTVRCVTLEDLGEDLPRVEDSISFQKVIEAAISCNLELRPYAKLCA